MARSRWLVWFVAAVVAVGACTVGAPAARAETPDDVAYRPPVDAPVVDAFRPPPNPYGVGNRGLTYDPAPDTTVVASADGEVVFVGAVAGTLHVTILHADGLRTSYSFLEATSVQRGARVRAGDPVGRAGGGFHFGVRRGDTYLDPAALFGAVETRVRLVPHEERLPPVDVGLLAERDAVRDMLRRHSVLGAIGDRLGGGLRRGVEVVRNGLIVADRINPGTLSARIGLQLARDLGRPCTAPEVATGPSAPSGSPGASSPARSQAGGDERTADEPRQAHQPGTALLVAGYGSNASHAAIDDVDTDALGYTDDEVVRFSYSGGRVPLLPGQDRLDPALAGISATGYGADDTFGDLSIAGRRLADLVETVAAARPGEPVDIYAHSQGGIVTRLALYELERRPGGLDALGVVVTIGTPHAGADLATVAQILPLRTHLLLDATAGRLAGIDSRATSVRQMASGSDLIRRLQRDGVPAGVDFRTIGARGDLIVTGDKTTVDGQPAAIVGLAGPTAHDSLPGAAATTTELRLALQGRPPACDGAVDTVLDAAVPTMASWAESTVGTLLAAL